MFTRTPCLHGLRSESSTLPHQQRQFHFSMLYFKNTFTKHFHNKRLFFKTSACKLSKIKANGGLSETVKPLQTEGVRKDCHCTSGARIMSLVPVLIISPTLSEVAKNTSESVREREEEREGHRERERKNGNFKNDKGCKCWWMQLCFTGHTHTHAHTHLHKQLSVEHTNTHKLVGLAVSLKHTDAHLSFSHTSFSSFTFHVARPECPCLLSELAAVTGNQF